MADEKRKLNYEIKPKRRPLTVSGMPSESSARRGVQAQESKEMEMVDVVWTHSDGFPPSQKDIAYRYAIIEQIMEATVQHAVKMNIINQDQAKKILAEEKKIFKPNQANSDIGILTVDDEERPHIGDQFNVPAGTPDHVIAMMCEEKRLRLAEAVGVKP